MRHALDDLLIDVLAPATVFAVGGRIRDEFRGRLDGIEIPPKDLDFVACGIELSDLVARLQGVGRCDVVGASFAVVKFRHPAGDADIALPRRERSTGAGHRDFEIESGPDIPIEDDLHRRDFRMNMIARRLRDDWIVDPYGGVGDIAARRIDIVAGRTFIEDPLRILRAAQFSARFAFDVSEDARQAMALAAPLIQSVSPERIGDEFSKLLTLAERPSMGLEVLRETGVLAYVWPELIEGVGVEQNEWHAYDVYRHNLLTLDATPAGDLVLRLAALLHDVGKPRTKDGPHFYRHEQVGADLVPSMLERLRLPTAMATAVTHLVRQHMYSADPDLSEKAIRRFIQRIGADHLERLFALRAADIVGSGLPKRDNSNERFESRVVAIVMQKPASSIRDLAIGGDDVIRMLVENGQVEPDFRGGPRVGEILRTLFERVIDDPALNDRAQLRAAAQGLIRDAVDSTPSIRARSHESGPEN